MLLEERNKKKKIVQELKTTREKERQHVKFGESFTLLTKQQQQ